MKNNLEKRYGFPVALATVVGMVIGIGIFFKAAPVLKAAGGNPSYALIAWVIGGVITIISAIVAVEVGAAIPETGGLVTWIKKLYGEKIGFMVGWTQAVIYTPSIIGVQSYFFAVFMFAYLGKEVSEATCYIVAIIAVAFVYIINIYTKKGGGYIQTVATAIKVIPLLAIAIFGMFSTNNPTPFIMSEAVTTATAGNGFKLVGMALVPVMFAYDGWIYVATIAGDIKNAPKTLPKVIIVGVIFIMICYIGLILGMLKVFPAEELMKQDGLGDVAKILFGATASKLILLGITISAFGAFNGNILISTRLPYTLAQEGNFIKGDYFAVVDEKNKQPVRASWLMFCVVMVILAIMWITHDPDTLSNIPVALFFVFYILVFIGVFMLRTKYKSWDNPCKTPLYPLLPIVAILGGVYILWSAVISSPLYMLISVLIALSGLLVCKNKK